MIRHLLRLVWNRKRSTALLLAELFVTFLVVALVTTTALYQTTNWRRPLGFDYKDVLVVSIDYQHLTDDTFEASEVEGFARLLQEAKSLPEVEAAAGAHIAPFGLGGMSTDFEHDGRRIDASFNRVTDDFAGVVGLEVVAGRWFSREDDGTTDVEGGGVEPVVVDRELADALFGSAEAAIGRNLDEPDSGGETPRSSRRVVGVIADYRSGGELAGPENFFFRRVRVGDTKNRPLWNLFLKVRPGAGSAFEESLSKRLFAIAPEWSFEVRRLAESRNSILRLRAAPLVAGGIVGSFLLAMVALSLIGVVWQNVTERTREIGLRRALGATAPSVHHQFVLEMLLLATVALAAGTAVVLQLPLLNLMGAIPLSVLLGGVVIANLSLLALAGLSAWLPSRMASRVSPSAALRHE